MTARRFRDSLAKLRPFKPADAKSCSGVCPTDRKGRVGVVDRRVVCDAPSSEHQGPLGTTPATAADEDVVKRSDFKRGFVTGCVATVCATAVVGGLLPGSGEESSAARLKAAGASIVGPEQAGPVGQDMTGTGDSVSGNGPVVGDRGDQTPSSALTAGASDKRPAAPTPTERYGGGGNEIDALENTEIGGRKLGLGELGRTRRHNAKVIQRASDLLRKLGGGD